MSRSIFSSAAMLVAYFLVTAGAGSNPNMESEVDSCSSPDSNGISTFIIKAQAPNLGEINNILIKFDINRKLPVSSTAFQDTLNSMKLVDRVTDPFHILPCPQLNTTQQNYASVFTATAAQQNSSGHTSWDRGHLTPVNPNRFSQDAVNKTFFCVNIAPQDPYTNQQPWKDVEGRSEVRIQSTAGAFVQTGLCSEDNNVDGSLTSRGWRIPACFWKLICYKDNTTGAVQVVGFIGDNSLVANKDMTKQAARSTATMTPRSQTDVLKLVSKPDLVGQAWTTAATSLIIGRGVTKSKIPTAAQCKAATTLSAAVYADWAKAVKG